VTSFIKNHLSVTAQTPIPAFSRDVSCLINAIRSVTLEARFKDHAETSRVYKSPQEGRVAMYERAADLHKLLVTWVLVADGERAQIYECHKDTNGASYDEINRYPIYGDQTGYQFKLVPYGLIDEKTMTELHHGDNWNQATSSSAIFTQNNDEIIENNYSKFGFRLESAIAYRLHLACLKDLFDRLVLVAPAGMIAELMRKLSSNVQDRIVGVLSKDLT
jgi:protein required for attachment to host cells